MPKISCLVPVYNGESYIENCLNSLGGQSFRNIEIIVINDKSTDNTLGIIKKIQQIDSRITIINNEEQEGISKSRNKALLLAKGRYIHFVDGDDIVAKNLYINIMPNLHKTDIDILIFNYYKVYKAYSTKATKKLKENHIYSTLEDKKLILKSGVTVWNKLYKREFLLSNNISFLEDIIYEDIHFCWVTIVLAKSIVYNKGYYYYYYKRNSSIMNTALSFEKALQIIIVMRKTRLFLQESSNFNYYKKLFMRRCLSTFISFFNKVSERKEDLYVEMLKELSYVDIKSLRGSLNFIKYLKYSTFLSGNYRLYLIIFGWFK